MRQRFHCSSQVASDSNLSTFSRIPILSFIGSYFIINKLIFNSFNQVPIPSPAPPRPAPPRSAPVLPFNQRVALDLHPPPSYHKEIALDLHPPPSLRTWSLIIYGVAPRANMNQQRSRRFRAAEDVVEAGAISLLMQVYRMEFTAMGGYLTDSGEQGQGNQREFMSLILVGLGYERPRIRIPAFVIMPIAEMVERTYNILSPYGMKVPQLTPSRIRLLNCNRTFSSTKANDRLGYGPIVPLQEPELQEGRGSEADY
ncbi:hypothetical protein L1887_24045 [Cichorium endivia]|nr:hypothetical protein L1887_24045 [Cichorium endivia]